MTDLGAAIVALLKAGDAARERRARGWCIRCHWPDPRREERREYARLAGWLSDRCALGLASELERRRLYHDRYAAWMGECRDIAAMRRADAAMTWGGKPPLGWAFSEAYRMDPLPEPCPDLPELCGVHGHGGACVEGLHDLCR